MARTLTVNDARMIAASDIATLLVDCVNEHGTAINAELAVIAGLDELQRNGSALVFAGLSAQLNFDKNVMHTQPVLRLLRNNATVLDIACYLKSNGIGLYLAKAKALVANRDFILNARDADMTHERLLQLAGFGPKVAAFALAMAKPTSRVYTLDTWMMRGLAVHAGIATKRDTFTITDAAYKILQAACVEAAEANNLPIFVSQWSVWNRFYRFKNEHKVHVTAYI